MPKTKPSKKKKLIVTTESGNRYILQDDLMRELFMNGRVATCGRFLVRGALWAALEQKINVVKTFRNRRRVVIDYLLDVNDAYIAIGCNRFYGINKQKLIDWAFYK